MAPDGTTYNWRRCHSVFASCCANCVETSCPQQWVPVLPFFKPAMQIRWMFCAAPYNGGHVDINPGPTTTHNQVWMCVICHKQIHGRKLILVRCNRIEHWVHLRCAGIHMAQYTDTWTFHLHKESVLTHT